MAKRRYMERLARFDGLDGWRKRVCRDATEAAALLRAARDEVKRAELGAAAGRDDAPGLCRSAAKAIDKALMHVQGLEESANDAMEDRDALAASRPPRVLPRGHGGCTIHER